MFSFNMQGVNYAIYSRMLVLLKSQEGLQAIAHHHASCNDEWPTQVCWVWRIHFIQAFQLYGTETLLTKTTMDSQFSLD